MPKVTGPALPNTFGTRRHDGELLALTRWTNHHAFRINGERNTCIWSAGALRDVLLALGHRDAECIRVEVVAQARGSDKPSCRMAGSFGDGSSRLSATDGWRGHLAVIVDRTPDDAVLLDPTLDQLRKGSEPDAAANNINYSYLQPFAARIPATVLAGWKAVWFTVDEHGVGVALPFFKTEHDLRYKLFPGIGGWKSKPAFGARWRRKLSDVVLTSYMQNQRHPARAHSLA
jgi:hypothetical protein